MGSWALEALARAGVGRLILVDFDHITPSNLNRQLLAVEETVGRAKCEVAFERLESIDGTIEVICFQERLESGGIRSLFDRCPAIDYLVDAIDSLAAKIDLIATALDCGIPVISAMGTGNRQDPTRLRVTDLSATHGDPFARRVRQGLRKRGIKHVRVVFSDEPPVKPDPGAGTVGSTPFVPPVAGFLMAYEVVADLALRQAVEP